MPTRYFALREKSKSGSLDVICLARTIEEHRRLVSSAYWTRWAAKRHDVFLSFDEFMSEYDEVQVIIIANGNT